MRHDHTHSLSVSAFFCSAVVCTGTPSLPFFRCSFVGCISFYLYRIVRPVLSFSSFFVHPFAFALALTLLLLIIPGMLTQKYSVYSYRDLL